jgi:hypothetical protein
VRQKPLNHEQDKFLALAKANVNANYDLSTRKAPPKLQIILAYNSGCSFYLFAGRDVQK